MHQLELFGLQDKAFAVEMPNSNIIIDPHRNRILQDWLDEDDSDGGFVLLYRSLRYGISAEKFHSNCNKQQEGVHVHCH